MKTKILYVLTSSEKDIYLEQLFVSISSVRFHMPTAHIVVVIDQFTKESLIGKRKDFLKEMDELVVIDLPQNLTGQQRSRILKTSCRNYVEGDFLFIDSDTIILKPLDEIDNIPFELAACRDSHTDQMHNPYRKRFIAECKKLGCDVSCEKEYFNSGVILAKDTPKVREFYKLWNRNWLAGKEHYVFMDQPSFAKTNLELEHFIKQIPDIWNCQIIHGLKFIAQAKILHILTTNHTKAGQEQIHLLKESETFEEIKKTGVISEKIKACFADPFAGFPDAVYICPSYFWNKSQTDLFKLSDKYEHSKLFRMWINFFVIYPVKWIRKLLKKQ